MHGSLLMVTAYKEACVNIFFSTVMSFMIVFDITHHLEEESNPMDNLMHTLNSL